MEKSQLCGQIKKRFGPDDDVSMMDIAKELCKIKWTKQIDPKTLFDDIDTIESQHECALSDKRKRAVVV